jgi:hypothetical protein
MGPVSFVTCRQASPSMTVANALRQGRYTLGDRADEATLELGAGCLA